MAAKLPDELAEAAGGGQLSKIIAVPPLSVPWRQPSPRTPS
jgi:hypothetical protein